MRLVSSLAITVTVLCGFSAPARAQSATGDIRGLVIDAAGVVLPAASITVANTGTGAERQVMTDAGGRFAALALPVGPYEVTARLPGFAARRQEGLRVQAGTIIALRMELTHAALPDTINVSGVPAVIDAARSSQSSVITGTTIENLPLNGRDVLDLATLVPGVSRHAGSGEFTIVGQRETLSSLSLDGFDLNDRMFGRSLSRFGMAGRSFPVPVEAVEVMRVDTAGYSAEYGGAAAGVISVVTRSGSNTFAGSAFDFYRDDALNSNTLLNEDRGLPKDPLHVNQFGGVLGGPISRGSHFFFVAYQGERGSTTDRSGLLAIPPRFPLFTGQTFAFAASATLSGGLDLRREQDTMLARSDHRFGRRLHLTLRYNGQETAAERDANGVLDRLVPNAALPGSRRAIDATAASVLGRSVVNEIRLQYGREREQTTFGAFARFAGFPQQDLLVVNAGSVEGRELRRNRKQVADTVSLPSGAHLLRAGVDAQFEELADRSRTLQRPLAGPDVDALGDPRRDLALFVQDSWQLRPSTTINAGLRYDRQRFPVAVADGLTGIVALLTTGNRATRQVESGNWGPRIGVAWTPVGSRHVLRGAYGIFTGRTQETSAGLASGSALGVLTDVIRLSSLSSGGVTTTIGGGPVPVSLRVVSADSELASARAQQASVGFEWEWMPYTSIGVTFMHVAADNLPRPTLATSTNPLLPVRSIVYRSAADSRYDGLAVELHRRFAQGSYYRVSYTVSKATDTAPEAGAPMAGPFDDLTFAAVSAESSANRAPASIDQRHHLAGSIVYLTNEYASRYGRLMQALLRAWTLSARFGVASGPPYSAYVAADLNRDGNPLNDIAPDTTRNQYNLPAQITLDGRLARDVHTGGATRVSLIVEMFNVRNRPNYTAVNNILYTVNPSNPNALVRNPLFGDKVAQASPRTVQLAVKFAF